MLHNAIVVYAIYLKKYEHSDDGLQQNKKIVIRFFSVNDKFIVCLSN